TVTGTGDTLISGNLTNSSGSAGIIKDGDGILTLAGTGNTYNGDTVLNSGTLLVTGALSSSSNPVVTANGGTLGGTGTIGRGTTVHADATLAPGTSDDTAGTLTINRNLT